MKPPPYRYHRSTSAAEAVALLAEHGDEAMLLSGGQSLMPMLNLRLARPAMLIDVFHIRELRGVEVDADHVRIGAMTTLRSVETASPADLGGLSVLSEAAGWVGHYPIRTRGTIGGSIAHADPAAEMPMVAVLLDGEVELLSRGGTRVVAAREFFTGYLDTARSEDEMVTALRLPRTARWATMSEHARRRGDYGIVLCGIAMQQDAGRCHDARIVLGGVADTPIRLRQLETALEGQHLRNSLIDEIAEGASAAIDPRSDAHASSRYRRSLAAALVRRCLRRFIDERSCAARVAVS